MDPCKTHGLYLVFESHVLLCNHLHLTLEEVASRERRKNTHKKLTFTTLFSYKPWTASPLQCSDLLVGNPERRPDDRPVAVGKHTMTGFRDTDRSFYFVFWGILFDNGQESGGQESGGIQEWKTSNKDPQLDSKLKLLLGYFNFIQLYTFSSREKLK